MNLVKSMLASPPRPGGTAFRDLLVHAIPDRDDPTFAAVLARRPNPGGAADPLRDDGADLDHLRVVLGVTDRLRRALHRAFAAYATVEVLATTLLGVAVLLSQYDVVYGSAFCDGAGSSSGSGGGQPCAGDMEESAGTGLSPGQLRARDEHSQSPDALRQEAVRAGLADGQALYVWAEVNLVMNALLYVLNCAVGKYPLGTQQVYRYERYSRRLRSLRGTLKMLSMLWYGAGCFVVWKADPTVAPPLFTYCTCVLLLSALVWACGCIVGSIARRCPKSWLRLLLPLLRRELLTVAIRRTVTPQRELEAVLEMSFQEEVARQQRLGRGAEAQRQRPAIPPAHIFEPADGVQTECAICLDEYEGGDELVALPCDPQHCFHKTCIERWLQNQIVCPLCKAEVPTLPETPSSGDDADSVAEAVAGTPPRVGTPPRALGRDAFGAAAAAGGAADLRHGPGLQVDLGGLSLEELGLDVEVQQFLLREYGGAEAALGGEQVAAASPPGSPDRPAAEEP